MNRLSAYSPHALVSIVFLLVVLLLCLKSQLVLGDTDFWWHVRAGDVIRQLARVPHSDSFSFTAGSHPWLNISWLWDVAYSFLAESGLYLPVIATALVNACAMALLCFFILRRGVGELIAIVTLLACLMPYLYMGTPRPHQVTFLFIILFYIITHTACNQRNIKLFSVLPLLMLLWANIHGGFIIGYIIIGAYGADALFHKQKKQLLMCAGIFIACLLAATINPLGIGVFEACYKVIAGPLVQIISEWQRLQFNREHMLHVAYLLLFLITFRLLNPKVMLAEKILSLFWASQAFLHERNLPIFVLLSAPVLALNLELLISRLPTKMTNALKSKSDDYRKDMTNSKVRLAAFCASLTVFGLLVGGAGKSFISTTVPLVHPIEEADYLRNNHKDLRLLNDYFEGGYLLYILGGSSKIFIDGRAETVYPPEVIDDYLKLYFNQPGWESMLEKHNINAVMLPHASPALVYFKENKKWRMVFEGKWDKIYLKTSK